MYRLCWTGWYCTPSRTRDKSHSSQPVEAGDNIILGKQGKFCSMRDPVLQSPEHLNVKVDSSVGQNPVQFIPFIKTIRTVKNKREGSVFGIAMFAHKAENVPRSAGRGLL